ncbi:exodeoxyribonuclease VII small subunit [Psychrobacter sp. 72-O-c]|uniref:exodeoxyribonuclease VII small subunit n=1 Tax=Psychrobacter sp. 72-O-c TaxID=2774125 RepID=UPI00191906B8|nr:exodeoxyribonuclease VII small subunit [Psychrobacter sp. 72-O-c]
MSTAPTRKRKKAAPKTFKAAYDILKTNAAELQQQDEPDIDNLMTTVEESITAYRVCETRINAVQRALDAAFSEEDSTTIEDSNAN